MLWTYLKTRLKVLWFLPCVKFDQALHQFMFLAGAERADRRNHVLCAVQLSSSDLAGAASEVRVSQL